MLEGIEQVDVKGEVGDAQGRMDFLDRRAARDFAGTLRVLDMHPEQGLDD